VTKAKKAAEPGVEGYRVRIVMHAALLHVLSATEPVVTVSASGQVTTVSWTAIEGTEHGDTIGFIRWSEVTAISWRKA
jgi:hypothetical protein